MTSFSQQYYTCAEVIGPFQQTSTNDDTPRNVYIDFEIPVEFQNSYAAKDYLTNYLKHRDFIINSLKITLLDEQPIEDGIYIISRLCLVDNITHKNIFSNFVNYNIKWENNILTLYYPRSNYLTQSKSSSCTLPSNFWIVPDGVGGDYY